LVIYNKISQFIIGSFMKSVFGFFLLIVPEKESTAEV